MNIALIIAGGVGARMHQDIPKQFINVYDKPVIAIQRSMRSKSSASTNGRAL